MPIATTNDGVKLFYETMGNPEAKNKVVFIMGFSASHRFWWYQSAYFSTIPDYQVLIYDNRGNGFSDSPAPPYTMQRMVDDALFLADTVKFDKFHLVGASMGGMIAHHVALAAIERVLSLTLMVSRTVGGFFDRMPSMYGIYTMVRLLTAKTLDQRMQAALDLNFPHPYLTTIDTDGKSLREKMYNFIAEKNAGIPIQTAEGSKGQMQVVNSHHLYYEQQQILKKATFPILAITGDMDCIVKMAQSEKMPELIGADLVIIEGAGHGLYSQCPELVNDLLHRHFERVGQPRNVKPEIRRYLATYPTSRFDGGA